MEVVEPLDVEVEEVGVEVEFALVDVIAVEAIEAAAAAAVVAVGHTFAVAKEFADG